jgi:hypothetical protein
MRRSILISVLALGAVAALLAGCGSNGSASGSDDSAMTGGMSSMHHSAMTMAATGGVAGAQKTIGADAQAVSLRVSLDRLLGEHALLAIHATQRGYEGGADFPALAKKLDANSVAISKAIGSVYGAAAAKRFLNGKFLWRDHITFFVRYTQALAKHDDAGQKQAVANLLTYVKTQAAFFAKATGLPKQALANDLTAHVLQLKGQLDAYARGDYAQSYRLAHAAYEHMFMTGDTLAAAIAEQQGMGGTASKAADLEVTLDRMLGEHAYLATWATQAGVGGGKNFPALGEQLDRNSVALSKAIGSLYGAKAGRQFLDGRNLWRAHIDDFVAYTVATANRDEAGRKQAVAKLNAYIPTQAAFFSKAIGLPKQVLVDDLTAHVLQLKGAVDAYHGKRYAQTFTLAHAAFEHMFMTGDALAGGIARQKGLS